jgi:hypothetical protein
MEENKMAKKYLLNSAVITTPGTYSYQLINVELLKEFLKKGEWNSTIGYKSTAMALEKLTGIKIPVNRKLIKMNVGDVAIVFRLTKRIIDPSRKNEISIKEVLENCEIGLLKKTRGDTPK